MTKYIRVGIDDKNETYLEPNLYSEGGNIDEDYYDPLTTVSSSEEECKNIILFSRLLA